MVIISPTIAFAMTCYIYAGEIIRSLNHALVRKVRQRVFGIYHSKYFAVQTSIGQLVLTVTNLFIASCIDNYVYDGAEDGGPPRRYSHFSLIKIIHHLVLKHFFRQKQQILYHIATVKAFANSNNRIFR